VSCAPSCAGDAAAGGFVALMTLDEDGPIGDAAGGNGEPQAKAARAATAAPLGGLRRSASMPLQPSGHASPSSAVSRLLTPPTEEPDATAGPGASGSSALRGVSRQLWSTRWDVHVDEVAADGGGGGGGGGAAPSPPLYCGSFDSEERAARAHDVARLHFALSAALDSGVLHGQGANAAAAAALATAAQGLNYSLTEYGGVEELIGMSKADFVGSMLVRGTPGARGPCERRF
jgi:hypothetical protein